MENTHTTHRENNIHLFLACSQKHLGSYPVSLAIEKRFLSITQNLHICALKMKI